MATVVATDATREQHEEQSAVDGSPSAVPTVDSSDAGEPSAAVSNRAVELTGVDGSRLRHQRSLHPPLYPSNLLTSSAVYITPLARLPPLSPALLYRHTTIAVSVFSLDPSVSVRFRRGDPSGDGAPA